MSFAEEGGLGTSRRPGPPFGPLLTPGEIVGPERSAALAAYDGQAVEALSRMARYLLEFLTAGHPDLGRPGAICPYVSKAVEQGMVQLTAFPMDREDEDAVREGMSLLRTLLADPEGQDGKPPARNRALVAVFPAFSAFTGAALIERVQKALKLSFIQRRLMIGQFYPTCPEPGLWNRDFRPLQSPVISLAIRNITVFDAPFMLDRAEYIDAFVGIFGRAGEESIAKAAASRPRDRRSDPGDASGPLAASARL